jgi:UDP-N-acetylmuramoyl-tripeptide--D-alanyl-D-alanine ligase
MLTLQTICDITNGRLLSGNPDQSIGDFHFDTRQLTKDSLFIALTGGMRDGHLFLEQAKSQGAKAALISNYDFANTDLGIGLILVKDTQEAFAGIAKFYRKTLSIPIIAVTGSNGKTTTKDLIAHILSYKKKVFKTYKNYNNHLGVPLSLLQIQQHDEIAVLEMGMNHAGEIDYLASIAQPDISVIVNVTDAHIEHLGSKENIAKAKGELLPHTSPSGFAILNGDNPYVRSVAHLNPGKTYFYRLEGEADIYATDITTDESGTKFLVHLGASSFECRIPMFGIYNVANVLPAIFIADHCELTVHEIQQSLASVSISPMRFERLIGPHDSILINDAYNASPTSMGSSLLTFAEILESYKKIVVLGDMYELGNLSDAYHQEIGQLLDTLKDQIHMVVTVGEKSRLITEQTTLPSRHFTTKEHVIQFLAPLLDNQHAVLFKASRGMKFEDIVNGLLNDSKEGS